MRMGKRQHGFTLVELLMVIAILSVLAALLLPSIENSLEMARRTQCANNLRQLGFSFHNYVEDYAEFPSYGPPAYGPWVQKIISQWGGKLGKAPWGYNTPIDRLMNHYVGFDGIPTKTSEGSLLIFHCPSDTGGEAGTMAVKPTAWDYFGTSYRYNSDGNRLSSDHCTGLRNKQLSNVRHPSRAVLCSDHSFNVYEQNRNPHTYMYWHNKAELGWGNVLFVDGHVAYTMATRLNPDYQSGDDYDFNVTR